MCVLQAQKRLEHEKGEAEKARALAEADAAGLRAALQTREARIAGRVPAGRLLTLDMLAAHAVPKRDDGGTRPERPCTSGIHSAACALTAPACS